MFVMGGGVKGGKVYGKWPGLEKEQLYEGRDLALTTDFRDVLGELVSRHIGNGDLRARVPGIRSRNRSGWYSKPAVTIPLKRAATILSESEAPEASRLPRGLRRRWTIASS